MGNNKFIKAVKFLVILALLAAISLVVLLHWKSDLIIDKVMDTMQHRLVDSLSYSEATLDWFDYFPSVAVHLGDLHVGSGNEPLMQRGDVDVVLGLWSLFKNKVIINRLEVIDAEINISRNDGRWSYEIFKKAEGGGTDTSFKTLIRSLALENTLIKYRDGKSMVFDLSVNNATMKGGYEHHRLESEIEMSAILDTLSIENYKFAEPFPFNLDGKYFFDTETGLQNFIDWSIENNVMTFQLGGSVHSKTDHDELHLNFSWESENPEVLKKWFPEKMLSAWNDYRFSGEFSGQARLEGRSSKKETPHVLCTAALKNGGIEFRAANENLKGIKVDLEYDSGDPANKKPSGLTVVLQKGSFLTQPLEGKFQIRNLDNPVMDISLKGALPAGLLNLMDVTSLRFEQGVFDISHFELNDFRAADAEISSFLASGTASFSVKDLRLNYLNNPVELTSGTVNIGKENFDIDFDQLKWKNATVSGLKGSCLVKTNQLDFTLQGELCNGQIECKGSLTGINDKPSYTARWVVKSIDIKALLASFSNFDQSFITSENLSGKADIWAETIIPFDDRWQILTNNIRVKSALDIKDGQLKGMKTLEDFGQYVHLEDLQDIRFNQMRNYMKIEAGQVYLPVMFIQSSAINLSISGIHGFDQKILYYLKLNAGQTAANKLKKTDVKREFKQARKTGWINMYFILNGTTSTVRYQQYRAGVISGFEQSAAMKESLRQELVDKFGYDVYWLEPNEWEDIPEFQ